MRSSPQRESISPGEFLRALLAQRFLFSAGGLVHFDEPLLRGAEDYGIVAAPAVRVAVLVVVVAEERTTIAEQFHDDGIRGENILAFVFSEALEIDALVVERRVNL